MKFNVSFSTFVTSKSISFLNYSATRLIFITFKSKGSSKSLLNIQHIVIFRWKNKRLKESITNRTSFKASLASAHGRRSRTVCFLRWLQRSDLINGSRWPARWNHDQVSSVVSAGITNSTLFLRRPIGPLRRIGFFTSFIKLSKIDGLRSRMFFLAAVTTPSRTTGTQPW